MAPTSLLLFRLRLRTSTSCYSYVIGKAQHLPWAKPFSSSPQPLWQPDPGPPLPPAPPPSSDPKAGLSARMSFVFDQIDAMERMRGAKDEALQRIRAWRQTKQQQQPQQGGTDVDGAARKVDLGTVTGAEVDRSQVGAEVQGMVMEQEGKDVFKKEVDLVHPWPEWIELMELLVRQNYFDHRRFDENQMVKDLPIDLSGIADDVGFDFARDWATVRTACLNFGRDRFDILRCDFMNFAKNTVCLQCDAKRPKRQLLPGEWECPECNFLNYRRNMACFHCDHKRPPDEFMENKMQLKQQGSRTRLERTAGLSNVSNGWNFDFDDDESDGADVAAFEFADPPRMNDGSLDGPPQRGITRGFEDSISEANSMPRICDRGRNFSEPDEKAFSHVPRTGFDDFDDENDDVDSYEIDHRPVNPIREVSPKRLSEFENSAGSEDFDDFDCDHKPHQSFNAASSCSVDDDDQNFDSESDVSNDPQQKSFKKRAWISAGNNQTRGMSDNCLGLDSDFDDNIDWEYSSTQRKGVEHVSRTRGSGRLRNYDSDDDRFGSDSKDYGYLHSNGNKIRGTGGNRNIRGNSFRDSDHSDSVITRNFEMRRGMSNRGISFGNTHDDWPYGGPRRKIQSARTNGDRAQRGKNEKYGLRGFDRPRKERFEYNQGGKSNQFNDRSRCSDEYRQGGRSNQWNNRSTGF